MTPTYRRGMAEWYVQPLTPERWSRLRWYAIGAGVLLLAGIAVSVYPTVAGTANPIETISVPTESPVDNAPLYIHVIGAVAEPGVYEISAGSRVTDVIDVAGGALESADLTSINLARTVNDGEQIIVAERGSASQSTATPARLNLNTATVVELEALPGIGPAIAARIVDFRESHGSFSSVDALAEVPGIGAATIDEFRDLVRV